jgi:hypothetical protein
LVLDAGKVLINVEIREVTLSARMQPEINAFDLRFSL